MKFFLDMDETGNGTLTVDGAAPIPIKAVDVSGHVDIEGDADEMAKQQNGWRYNKSLGAWEMSFKIVHAE